QLPDGGVLVVGASATGVQLAAELRRSGRPVTLSVGEHVRLPRAYRGRDVLWWMDASGVWDQRYDEVEDLTRARRLPSPQLAGAPDRTTLDLNALASMGVEMVGRWAAVRDGCALFSGGLRNVFSLADLKMERLLDTFDEWAKADGCDAEVGPPERFAQTRVPDSARLQLDLRSGEIRAIVWATGFRPDYGWLDVPVIDTKGQLNHEGGVVDSPGLYALGLPVLRRRRSTFICGTEDDAREVIEHLAWFLGAGSSAIIGRGRGPFSPPPRCAGQRLQPAWPDPGRRAGHGWSARPDRLPGASRVAGRPRRPRSRLRLPAAPHGCSASMSACGYLLLRHSLTALGLAFPHRLNLNPLW